MFSSPESWYCDLRNDLMTSVQKPTAQLVLEQRSVLSVCLLSPDWAQPQLCDRFSGKRRRDGGRVLSGEKGGKVHRVC